jgi:hypothetical protein
MMKSTDFHDLNRISSQASPTVKLNHFGYLQSC